MVQSPELYIMKDSDSSAETVAFVFHMGDSLVTILQMVDKHKYDVKLYDLYAFKCTLNTQVRSISFDCTQQTLTGIA